MQPIEMVDAIARFTSQMGVTECAGYDADATAAYTQVKLDEADDLLGPGKIPDTWVRLPKDQWPAAWVGKYKDPVVQLQRNLYGHPKARHLWAKYAERKIMELGFGVAAPFECMYVHRGKSFC